MLVLRANSTTIIFRYLVVLTLSPSEVFSDSDPLAIQPCRRSLETHRSSQGLPEVAIDSDRSNLQTMDVRKEVREHMRICEILIGCIHHDGGFTDEEYQIITQSSRELEKEIFVYRLEHFKPSIPTLQ